MRVLFGWEFGAGLGHLTRFKPIGERLVAAGVEVTLALQDIDKAGPFLDPETGRPYPGYTLVQAPRWNISTDPALRKIPTHSFADVLRLIGMGYPGAFPARLEAWRGLIDLVKPDLAIGDFAPTLAIAARGRVPSIMVGNGYTTPPAGRPMPPIRPWQDALQDFSIRHEAELQETINAALARSGAAPLEHLADMFHGDETFVFTLPLVDPYAKYRQATTLPPFNLPRGIAPKPWAERRDKGVFLYLPRAHPKTMEVIQALGRMPIQGVGHISSMGAQTVAESSSRSMRLHVEPRDFAVDIPDARLMVHHGGLSTAVACLLAGTPQLILPWNLEHLVTARAVEATGGAAIYADDPLDPKRFSTGVGNLLRKPDMAAKAEAAGRTISLGEPEAGVRTVLDAATRLTGREIP